MSLFVLEAFFLIFGVRGHIPRCDGLPERPAKSSFTENSTRLVRILAVVTAAVAVLLLVVWAAVSIAIKSL